MRRSLLLGCLAALFAPLASSALVLPPSSQRNATWAGRSKGCVAVVDDVVVLAGGYGGGSTYYNDVYHFQPSSSSDGWSSNVASGGRFIPRQAHACQYFDGALYLVAGNDASNTKMNDVWSSVDKGVTWTQRSTAPFPPNHYPTLAEVNGALWIAIGGATPGNMALWRSTTPGTSWSQVSFSSSSAGTVPPARLRPAFGVSGGKLLLAGGYGTTVMNDAWSFNTVTMAWTALTSYPGARNLFGGVAIFGGKLILVGGQTENQPLPGTEDQGAATDIATFDGSTWARESASPLFPVSWPMAVAYRGALLVLGGDAGLNDVYNSVYASSLAYNTPPPPPTTTTPGGGGGTTPPAGGGGGTTPGGGGTTTPGGTTTGSAGGGTTTGGGAVGGGGTGGVGASGAGGASGGGAVDTNPGDGVSVGGVLDPGTITDGDGSGIIIGDGGSSGADAAIGGGGGGGDQSEVDGGAGGAAASSGSSVASWVIPVAVVAGVLVCLLLILLLVLCRRRRERLREEKANAAFDNSVIHGGATAVVPPTAAHDMETGWISDRAHAAAAQAKKQQAAERRAGVAGGAGAAAAGAGAGAQHGLPAGMNHVGQPPFPSLSESQVNPINVYGASNAAAPRAGGGLSNGEMAAAGGAAALVGAGPAGAAAAHHHNSNQDRELEAAGAPTSPLPRLPADALPTQPLPPLPVQQQQNGAAPLPSPPRVPPRPTDHLVAPSAPVMAAGAVDHSPSNSALHVVQEGGVFSGAAVPGPVVAPSAASTGNTPFAPAYGAAGIDQTFPSHPPAYAPDYNAVNPIDNSPVREQYNYTYGTAHSGDPKSRSGVRPQQQAAEMSSSAQMASPREDSQGGYTYN